MPRKALGLGLAVVCLFSSTTAARQPRKPAPSASPTNRATTKALPLTRVVLYSNGVAQLERRGRVTGNVEMAIPFKQSQVDDVLKSLLVVDLGRGRIGSVSYDASTPASSRLAEVPFSIDTESDGLVSVLQQLQGARLQVSGGGKTATGNVLSVQRKSTHPAPEPAKQGEAATTIDRLVVATDTGELASFDLDRVTSIRLLDDGAKRDIAEFTSATSSARRRDAKTIVVTSDGAGDREMIVRYTIAAPIWKTSYRLLIDDDGRPFVQGWAIVDNTGEEDWTDVALTLVSGSPLSFIEPLQMPLYRHRPVHALPANVALEPQVVDIQTAYLNGEAGGVPGGVAGGVGYGTGGGSVSYGKSGPQGALALTTLSDAVMDEDSGVVAETNGQEVGDLFQYAVTQPVTVERNRSALIPILQTRLDGERVALYNEDVDAERPMSGVRLKNSSTWTLEAGALTVLDGDDYAGEATIDRLKPGEENVVVYAVDLGTKVAVESRSDREPVFLLRAVNGDLQAHYYQVNEKTYTLRNQTDRERVVLVEYPKHANWKLSNDTPKPVETTDDHYRFRVALAPHAVQTLHVAERQALMEVYTISNITSKEMDVFVEKHYLDDETRAALQAILDLKVRIAETMRSLERLDEESKEIEEDQARVRENLKSLGTTSEAKALVARYIAKANEQETRVEQIAAERNRMRAAREALQSELDRSIRSLAVDRRFDAQ